MIASIANRRLAGLAVTDDQLTLTTADRDHRINCLDARLERLAYRLAVNNAWGLALKGHFIKFSCQRSFAVDRFGQRVDNTA